MRLIVQRFPSSSDSTGAILYLDGERECFGLEDEERTVKVWGETRIPGGTYVVGVRKEGGFFNRYSARFGEWHKGMLHILDVPGFDYVLIHIGNDDDDTAGCLLVGKGIEELEDGNFRLINSTSAYKRLYRKVIGAALDSKLSITFLDM